MPSQAKSHWKQRCIEPVSEESRLDHVRFCSPFAAHLIDRHPEWLEQLRASRRLEEESPPRPERAEEWVAAYGLDDGLRAFRNQEMLRIVWRDLCGLAPLGSVLRDLTTLAETCLEKALSEHHLEMCQKHGTPRDENGEAQALVVIGFGKLGGEELNLSSDIDLLFCFPSGGQCDGPRALSNEEYFARLSRRVIASLADVRATGFCFRVDTRLRPFGKAGPIAFSFAALEQYYQREGRDWERYALIKARPVAGDLDAGADLLESLRPFVYRRYIDFGAIEALREMQSLIRAEAGRVDRKEDVKRGPGGIREIEFLAQGFQLLRGGRDPRLQTPRLAEALDAITALGLLPEEESARLREHYTVLRHIENRLQAMHDQQTHRIPEGEDLDRLCRGTGHGSPAAFNEALAGVRQSVSRIFDQTWSASDTPEPATDRWQERWTQLQASLGQPEVSDDAGAGKAMRAFLSGLARRPASQRSARRLDRFMPMLLERASQQELDEATMSRLLDLVLVITHRSAYLALLAENPGALDRTVTLFSASPWISARVSRFPELLDELIDPALGQHIPDRETLENAVSRKLGLDDEEAALAGLNYLKQATCLRLAVAWLECRIDEAALQDSLTVLAEVMIGATLRMARAELQRRHGSIPGSGVAVVGYGSLGARELAIESDLDLVFLYRQGEGESDGERPLAPERWFVRLAQRMVALLTALTPSGKLYDIDTRLRPNGQSGLLVTGIDAFRNYQMEAAWTWEAQALTRARAVGGDETLAAQFEDIRLKSLQRERDSEALRKDLLDMRERIRKSHGAGSGPQSSVKHGAGGLVDIGFLAQFGVLELAAQHPEVAEPTGAAAQLEKLQAAGWLDLQQHELLQARLAHLQAARIRIELDPGADLAAAPQPDHAAEAVSALFTKLTGG